MPYLGGYTQGGYVLAGGGAVPLPVVDSSNTPRLRAFVDFVTDANPSGEVAPARVWTNVSSYVRKPGFSLDRGRTRPLDKVEAGNGQIVFDNFDRAWDSENDLSPFWPGVSPMRAIRLESVHNRESEAFTMASSMVGGPDLVGGGDSFTYNELIEGVIEKIVYSYPQGKDAYVTVDYMDLLGSFARDDLDHLPTHADEPGYRVINRLLNTRAYTGRVTGSSTFYTSPLWQTEMTPSPDRDISEQGSMIIYTTPDANQSGNLLDSLQKIAESEGGNFFIARTGRPTYRDRNWTLRPTDEHLRFAIDANRFKDIEEAFDETLIFNDITITMPSGALLTFVDQPSINRFYDRKFTLDSVLATSADVTTRGRELLFGHRQPVKYLAKLDLSNIRTADWLVVLSRELWDVIDLAVPYPNGDVVMQRSLIEGIHIESPTKRDWKVWWWLSVPPFPNLFSDDESGFENGVAGWTPLTNCVLSSESDYTIGNANGPTAIKIFPPQGDFALFIDPVADGDMEATSPFVTVESRRDYLATLQLRLARTGAGTGFSTKVVHIVVDWYDASLTLLSSVVGPNVNVNGFGGQWKLSTAAGRSPSAAAFARMRVLLTDADLGGGLYADVASIARSA